MMMSYRNTFNRLDIDVDEAWSNVEVAYQRRYDLIPNLANTVKGYLKFEHDTFVEIAEARSAVGGAVTTEEKLQATSALESAFSRLLVVMEDYPELQGIEAVQNLMVELEGTENRVKQARRDFNDAVKKYNRAIAMWPGSFFANMFGFEEKAFFEAVPGAEIAPTVNITITG